MTRVRKVLTFSNVIAVIALFVALGGSVYAAGKISGKQIKANSLPGNRIKPKSVTAKQVKPGSLTGAQIKAGSLTAAQIKAGSLTGAQINGSTLTGVSAESLGSVTYSVATTTLSTSSSTGASVTATCPPGTFATGGGATLSSDKFAIVNDSGPTPPRTGWEATGFSSEPDISMTVTAICTAVKAIH